MMINRVPTTSAIAVDRLSSGRCRTAHLEHFRMGPSRVCIWNAGLRSSEIPQLSQRWPEVTSRLCSKQTFPHVDLQTAGDLECAILERVDTRVGYPVGRKGGGFLLLELLDLWKKHAKYQIDSE